VSVPIALESERRLLSSSVMAAVIHAGFLALLLFGVQWQNHAPAPVQAELWSALPALPASVPATEAAPAPAPAVPPVPAPVKASEPAATPKPDLVIEKAPRHPPEAETPPRAAPSPREQARLAREEAALQKLDRELREQATREQLAQQQSESAEEQRLARLQRDADASQKAQADAARARLLQSYVDRMQAKIKGNTIVPPSVPNGATLTVAFVVLADGSVLDGSIRVVRGSGQATYDDAVQRAIIASQPLPMPDDPGLRRQMRDVTLKTTNLR
jgi:colicin import membrane protein